MSSGQNWYDIGNEIRTAVLDSLHTGNFDRLGDTIAGTVNDVVEEARRQSGSSRNQSSRNTSSGRGTYNNPYSSHYRYSSSESGTWRTENDIGRNASRREDGTYTNGTYGQPENPQSAAASEHNASFRETLHGTVERTSGRRYPFRINSSSRIPSWIMAVGGGCASAFFLLNLLIGLLSLSLVGKGVPYAVFSGIMLALCGTVTARGIDGISLLSRCEKYARLTGGKTYLELSQAASGTGRSVSYVLKDVRKMIRRGIFPEGHLDNTATTLMLTDSMYREYSQIEEQRVAQAEAEHLSRNARSSEAHTSGKSGTDIDSRAESAQDNSGSSDSSRGVSIDDSLKKSNPELAEMIGQGNDCIRRLHTLNDQIEGEVISAKLDRLESLMHEIFSRVADHPEQMKRMHKFMDYYLPTTLKLVEAYKEFDSVSSPGEDILQAESEIEQTLDTINSSFEELLNQLFRDSVFDATADAKVLKTMLQKEGLSGSSPFRPSGSDTDTDGTDV